MIGIDKNTDPMDAQSHNSDVSIDTVASVETRTASNAPMTNSWEIDQLVSSYDYELPPELIAQTPLSRRDSSRLLVVDSPTHHTHSIFRDLPQLLRPKDLLVLNDTRVIPARLYGRKSTGAPVEVLLLEERQKNCWLALVKPGRRLKPGAKILFEPHRHTEQLPTASPSIGRETTGFTTLSATVLARDEATGGRLLQFDIPDGASWESLLEQYGQIPLPPYITNSDRTIKQASVTLHVGVGTFRPVEVEDVTRHKMHGEWLEVPASTVEQIRETKASGGRVIAVGTTVVRALEGASAGGELQPYCGKTELFIYPGYQWRVVDGLITNFHLPRSSLLMLVSAMVGRERLMDLYKEAIAHQYRFYSFGDAMLILPEARRQ
jgi:S-adenosylmethionine:tRNA ribosyltransferase-isomerase